MIISVTADDIAKGVKHSAYRCPVARAISRAAGYPVGVFGKSAEGSVVEIGNSRIALPDTVNEFFRDYDLGLEVHPFSFEVTQ